MLGGIGLGLGYISPVSTLIKWFPDRPGMATGMAIMGFGGGAMIASPLSTLLMAHFKTSTSLGVAPTFVAMGVLYFAFMMYGVFSVRVPPPGWAPVGYKPGTITQRRITSGNVTAAHAIATPQFWLLWLVLCLNVTAGIGVLGQASPMIQEMFPRRDLRERGSGIFRVAQSCQHARQIFLVVGVRLRRTARRLRNVLHTRRGAIRADSGDRQNGKRRAIRRGVRRHHQYVRRRLCYDSRVPERSLERFRVGASHGRLLTAWSTAGILGPVLVNYIREYEIAHGVAKADAYTTTMHIMAALLVVGFACNLLVRPVDEHHVEVERPSMSPLSA